MFINNQNLGRYWNIGPQETLYLPGVWLGVGLNKVVAHPRDPPPALPSLPRRVSWGAWVGRKGQTFHPETGWPCPPDRRL